MNTDDLSESVSWLIRTIWPGHQLQRFSRRMGVPFGTARSWFYERFSVSRTIELCDALEREMDEQDARRAEARLLLKRMRNEWGIGPAGAPVRLLGGEGKRGVVVPKDR